MTTTHETVAFPTMSVGRLLLIGWTIVAIVFGGSLIWSVAAPFEGAVIARGQLAVKSNRQSIQHLEGGIVEEIYVREFDSVEEGQALIRLDDTPISARLQSLDARLYELLGEEARLNTELDGGNELAIRQDLRSFPITSKLESILDEQAELMQTRREGLRQQIDILQQRISQNRVRISGMHREIESKDTEIKLVNDEINQLEDLYERGLATLTRLLALKRERARVEGAKEALISEIAAIEVQIGEAAIEQQRLERNFREEIQTRLRDTKTQISELVEERTSLVDRKKRTIISAPRAGRVLGVQAHTVGGVVVASQPIMYIVPRDDRLVATLQIDPTDIDKVEIGQPASLRFTSFNQNKTPVITARIDNVSADVFDVPDTGRTYYEAVVELSAENLNAISTPLIPGMPVEALLKTERRNVLSYLVKPLADSYSLAFRE